MNAENEKEFMESAIQLIDHSINESCYFLYLVYLLSFSDIDINNHNKIIKGEKRNMELKDTIEMMQSDDYKLRFKSEYYQTKIRYDKLHAMIVKYEAGTLEFEPKCDIGLLKGQASHMGMYLYTLEVRAQIEGIDL